MPTFTVPEEKPFMQPGIHILEIVEATNKVSKTGNEMIQIELQHENGSRVRDFLVFTAGAAFKLKQIIEATGKKLKAGESISLTDFELLEFPPLGVEVIQDPENTQFCKVKRYMTMKAALEYAKKKSDADDEGDEIPF